MQRLGAQQLGITNVPEDRIKYHKSNCWIELDRAGPHPVQTV